MVAAASFRLKASLTIAQLSLAVNLKARVGRCQASAAAPFAALFHSRDAPLKRGSAAAVYWLKQLCKNAS